MLKAAFPSFNRYTLPGVSVAEKKDGAWFKKLSFWNLRLSTPNNSEIPYMVKFPPGSWEHAVACTYHDAHNQLGTVEIFYYLIYLTLHNFAGLNILSFAIELQKVGAWIYFVLS